MCECATTRKTSRTREMNQPDDEDWQKWGKSKGREGERENREVKRGRKIMRKSRTIFFIMNYSKVPISIYS